MRFWSETLRALSKKAVDLPCASKKKLNQYLLGKKKPHWSTTCLGTGVWPPTTQKLYATSYSYCCYCGQGNLWNTEVRSWIAPWLIAGVKWPVQYCHNQSHIAKTSGINTQAGGWKLCRVHLSIKWPSSYFSLKEISHKKLNLDRRGRNLKQLCSSWGSCKRFLAASHEAHQAQQSLLEQ